MVRLVFRPYTQIRRSICTLESLQPSTIVSDGFGLLRHSSPSFGSPQKRSHSNLDYVQRWSVDAAKKIAPKIINDSSLSLCPGGLTTKTRAFVRLLGPCFKTGCKGPFCLSRSWLKQISFNTQTSQTNLNLYKKQKTLVPYGSVSAISGSFHFLFKILFIFRSHYLFAIGLSLIFSLTWSLPRTLNCSPKQLDSQKKVLFHGVKDHGALTLPGASLSEDFSHPPLLVQSLQTTTPGGFTIWTLPASVALTDGIVVTFFSSAQLYA